MWERPHFEGKVPSVRRELTFLPSNILFRSYDLLFVSSEDPIWSTNTYDPLHDNRFIMLLSLKLDSNTVHVVQPIAGKRTSPL